MFISSDGISLFVDGQKYGEVTPPTEGFYQSANENKVQAASQWLKGTVMAPFDDMVSRNILATPVLEVSVINITAGIQAPSQRDG